jgi:hypothetical protein
MVKRYTCWGDITWRDEAGVDHAPLGGMDVRVVLAADYESLEADNRLLRAELAAGVDHYQTLAAELAEAKEEADHNYRLISRQGRLLSATVNVLRGDPPDDTLWSVHDVVELTQALVETVRDLENKLRSALDECRDMA